MPPNQYDRVTILVWARLQVLIDLQIAGDAQSLDDIRQFPDIKHPIAVFQGNHKWAIQPAEWNFPWQSGRSIIA